MHGREIGRAVDEAAFLPGHDEAGVGQRLQMKGKRCRRHLQRLADGTNGQPGRPSLYEQAPGGQPGFLRQCSQLNDDHACLFRFHISNYIEMLQDEHLPRPIMREINPASWVAW
jgi:hypothetical protein